MFMVLDKERHGSGPLATEPHPGPGWRTLLSAPRRSARPGVDAEAGGVSQFHAEPCLREGHASLPPSLQVRNVTLPILAGASVVLRAPRPSDIEDRLALGRDRDIHRMYGGSGSPPPLTREQAAAAIEALMADPYAWVIEHEGCYIGQIRLHSIVEADQRARLAIGISDPAKLGRGLGSEAVRLLLAHGFGALGLHRIDLRVLAYNARAIRAYQKCGFQVEGRERESALVDGQWHDDLIMSMLAHEFTDAFARR